MVDLQDTTLSTTSNFTLLGENEKERLAFNGAVVSVNDLRKAGFKLGQKYVDGCSICSPTEKKRIWRELSPVNCNNISGSIWFCIDCSRAYLHKKRGQEIWSELSKTLKPDTNSSVGFSNLLNADSYLPDKEDFESAYRRLTRPGETISIDAVLDQIETSAIGKGLSLKIDWRMITEKNIEIWSKKGQ